MSETRYAEVTGARRVEEVVAYLPGNYSVIGDTTDDAGRLVVLISGEDNAGWTLDGYVSPRLASGLMGCKETSDPSANEVKVDESNMPLWDWQYEVANGDTVLGYDEWLAHQNEQNMTTSFTVEFQIVVSAASSEEAVAGAWKMVERSPGYTDLGIEQTAVFDENGERI